METNSLTKSEELYGEITFHKKIGMHDISVAKVISSEGFIKWVENYLKSLNVDNPNIPEEMKKIINEYIKEGFIWFVFDVIELDNNLKTNEAIQYRFKTDFLYYPLKISKTEKGYTNIDLLILSKKLLSNFLKISSNRIDLRHEPISLTSKELSTLNEEMDTLLEHSENMMLRIWKIQGDLSSFDKDLLVK